MSPVLKPYTLYICPRGEGTLGHSSRWTGAYNAPSEQDGTCICGEEWVEEVKDGSRYRLEWESVDPWFAAEQEAVFGGHVWSSTPREAWAVLPWHPVSRESESRASIEAQYRQLKAWAESREQPIRNVRLLRSATLWEEVGRLGAGGGRWAH